MVVANGLEPPGHQIIYIGPTSMVTLEWRHNERDNVYNYRHLDCLLKRLFSRRSKKTSKLCVTGLCEGNLPVTTGSPSQKTSNAENVSIWWRHKVEISPALFVSHAHGLFN